MDLERIVYQLTVEDLQTVAKEELGRELTEKETLLVEDKLADKIAWYEAIYNTINELNIE
jgi:hypothetical protein